MATSHPEILWAQRSNEFDEEKNIVYFTINLPNIIGEPELSVTENEIKFSAKAGAKDKANIDEKTYAFTLPLYAPILPDLTKKAVTTRHVALILRKKDAQAEYWPRITKEKIKSQFIKTDFSKYVDEDEQNEAPAVPEQDFQGMGGGGPPGMGGMGGMGGMDMASMMGGMGGGGGMGGMDMASMMGGMGGGAGGAGGMDIQKLLAQMQAGKAGGAGGMPDFGAGGDSDDEGDDDEMPALVDEDEAK